MFRKRRFQSPALFGAAVAAATTTWDPSAKGSAITLSGGNLVATSSSASNAVGRAVASHSTGKYYFECTATVNGGTEWTVGLANASYSITQGALYLSNDAVCIRYNDGAVYINTSSKTSGLPNIIGSGGICGIAVDLTTRRAWFTTNGSAWNANSDNPNTATGGVDISAVTGALFPAYGIGLNTNSVTANFGASAYAYTKPTGFGDW